jgi:hypothetical protein
MRTTVIKITVVALLLIISFTCSADDENSTANGSMLIDHTCTDITAIPVQYIEAAKQQLIIAYGHTSHGSQLTDGMSALVAFANNGGKGMTHPNNIFAWNDEGTGGALHLNDYAMGGDVGYYPDWYNNTMSYLGKVNPATGKGENNQDVNVIMWSWCGQAAGYSESQMVTDYLTPMSQLENEYFNVKFIYMTCHLDGTGANGNLNKRNEQIRNFCKANNKILYDFADIESYDPDGNVNYMELYGNDNCDYTPTTGGSKNWATAWQESHTENVDWYECSAAHSQSLNGNRKAFAAWWMFARMAGWNPDGGSSVAVDNKKRETLSWSVVENCLRVSVPSIEKIDRIELYDLKGNKLYCKNNPSGSEAMVPLSGANFNGKNMAFFRIISSGKSYSGKFTINTF